MGATKKAKSPPPPGRSDQVPFTVLIITGLSGSGKSTVLRALENVGYFCIDNLPLSLLSPYLKEVSRSHRDHRNIALVMDVRTEGFLQNYTQVFKDLEAQGYHLRVLFLEAEEKALIRRFSQTRRQHPLADRESISHALRQERESLQGLRQLAHRIIDTSSYNPHQLRKLIIAEYTDLSPTQRMALHLTSFAYKNGIPPEADLVIDVGFLPNPYFIEEPRPLTRRVCCASPGECNILVNGTSRCPKMRQISRKYVDLKGEFFPRYQQRGRVTWGSGVAVRR